MVQSPEDLRVWLKFDSANPAVNSGGMTNTVRTFGKPGRMPPDRGIYRNWGAFFDFGDSLLISGGVDIMGTGENHLEWSITFQTILPAAYDTMQERVLVQNILGTGAYFALDDTGNQMGCIDELTDEFIDAGIELSNNKKIKRGWHHIAIVCSRDEKNPEKQNV